MLNPKLRLTEFMLEHKLCKLLSIISKLIPKIPSLFRSSKQWFPWLQLWSIVIHSIIASYSKKSTSLRDQIPKARWIYSTWSVQETEVSMVRSLTFSKVGTTKTTLITYSQVTGSSSYNSTKLVINIISIQWLNWLSTSTTLILLHLAI